MQLEQIRFANIAQEVKFHHTMGELASKIQFSRLQISQNGPQINVYYQSDHLISFHRTCSIVICSLKTIFAGSPNDKYQEISRQFTDCTAIKHDDLNLDPLMARLTLIK